MFQLAHLLVASVLVLLLYLMSTECSARQRIVNNTSAQQAPKLSHQRGPRGPGALEPSPRACAVTHYCARLALFIRPRQPQRGHTPPSPHIHYIICLRLKKFVFLYSRRDSLLLLFFKQVYLYFAVFTIYVVCMKEELYLNFA